jgi:hypothetical protein
MMLGVGINQMCLLTTAYTPLLNTVTLTSCHSAPVSQEEEQLKGNVPAQFHATTVLLITPSQRQGDFFLTLEHSVTSHQQSTRFGTLLPALVWGL